MTIFQAFVLAVIEGITEFLPISSTGHMILTAHYLTIENPILLKSFEVIIQFGAILSVVFFYKNKFLKMDFIFYKKLILAFIPTGIIGFLLKNKIDLWLDSVHIVAWALVLGGIVLIACDFIFKPKENPKTFNNLNSLQIASLGLFQAIALIPGVSRSAATIVGGLVFKLSKKEAAEFSFFLAVPTMTAATLYKSVKIIPSITANDGGLILFGLVIAFMVAYFAIKFFIHVVGKYGFLYFGIYRIILGLLIILIE
ncbi:MAG: undecaprenyl-diphosphate phosphatase [Deltaproteobacteria bacterium]|nr:undecaprenyl-diphosphate phosphatase [Deltaproteobacteria bacterium]